MKRQRSSEVEELDGGRQPSIIKRVIHNTLDRRIPRRFKRLIFLSSVLGVIKGLKKPDADAIDKLNRALHIAHNKDAMLFPMQIHSWIWRDRLESLDIELDDRIVSVTTLSQTKLDNSDFFRIALYFIEHAPKWLIYGSIRQIAADLQTMFRNFFMPLRLNVT